MLEYFDALLDAAVLAAFVVMLLIVTGILTGAV